MTSSLTFKRGLKKLALVIVGALPLWLPVMARADFFNFGGPLGLTIATGEAAASTTTNNFGCGGVNTWLPAVEQVSGMVLGE